MTEGKHIYTTDDGITVTRRAVTDDRWDAAIEVSHPEVETRSEVFYSGGEAAADALTRRLLAKMRALLAR